MPDRPWPQDPQGPDRPYEPPQPERDWPQDPYGPSPPYEPYEGPVWPANAPWPRPPRPR